MVSLALSFAAWWVVRRADERRLKDLQNAQATAMVEHLGDRMKATEEILRSAADFLGRGSLPSRAEWKDYVDHRELPKTYPGIQGMGFAEWIPRPALPDHLRRVRAEGFPDYSVVPGGPLPADADGCSSIIYLEPMDARNLQAFGKDMFAEATRREAMKRARDTGLVSLTGPVTLFQESGAEIQVGTLLYAPVYRQGLPLGTVAQRRQAFRGWAYYPFRMGDLVRAALTHDLLVADFELFDGSGMGKDSILFDSDPSQASPAPDWELVRSLDLGGRIWTVRVRPTPAFFAAAGHLGSWQILAGGLLASLLVFTLLVIVSGSEGRALRLAAQRAEELLATEAKFSSLFEGAPLGMAIVDTRSGRFLSVNPRLGDILGRAPDELRRLTFMDVTHPEDVQADVASVKNLESGSFREYQKEKRYLHRDGRTIWASLSVARMATLAGQPPAHLALVEDVSARHLAEEQARRATEFVHHLLDAIPANIAVLDGQGVIAQVNRSWSAFSEADGGPPGATGMGVGASYLEVYEKSGDEEVLAARQGILAVISGRIPHFSWDYECDAPDRRRWFKLLASPIPGHEGCLVAHFDITDLKLAEESIRAKEARFQLLFDALPIGVTLTDGAGQILQTNPASEALLGIPADEMRRREFKGPNWDIVRPDGSPMPAEEYPSVRALQEHRRIENVEMGVRRPDGSLTWIQVTAEPVHGPGVGVIIVYSDITAHQQIQRERALNDARLRLITEGLKDYILMLDREGRITFISRIPPGIPESSVLGADFTVGLAVADRELAKQAFTDCLATGESTVYRASGTRHDGTLGWFEVRLEALREEGRITSVLVLAFDRTEYQAIEQAREASEARFRALFERTEAVHLLIDPQDGRITDANPAALAFYGWPREELLAKRIQDINLLPPEEVGAEMAKARAERKSYFTFPHRLASGEVREVEVYSSPIELDGHPQLVSIVHDITSRRRAEQALEESRLRYLALFDLSPDGISVSRVKDGALLEVNAAWETLFGYPREEATNFSAEQLRGLYVEPEDRRGYYQRLRTEGHLPLVTNRFKRKDGTPFLAEMNSRVMDIGGEPCWVVVLRDVTLEVEYKAALQESESQFRRLADHAPVLIWVAGTDMLCSWFNQVWLDWTGRTMEQELGNGWAEGVHPEDAARCLEIYTVHFEARRPFAMEYRLRHRDGRYRWLLDRGEPHFDRNGVFQGYLGACSDIDDQKRAQEALAESESRFRSLVEGSPVPLFLHRDGRFVYLNPAGLRLLGAGALEELVGQPVLDRVHPDSREQVLSRVATVLKSGEAQGAAEERFLALDGTVIEVEVQGRAIVYQGLPTVLAFAQDITERRRAQETLKQTLREQEIILETANVGISLVVERKQVWINSWMERTFQYSTEEMLGQTTRLLYPDQRAYDRLGREAYPALARGEAFETLQELVRKDGQRLWIHYNGRAIDPSDMSRGTLWIVSDVTAQKQVEDALRESEARFRTLSDTAPVLIWMSGPDRLCTSFNHAWLEWTGRPLEESLGTRWVEGIHPEDSARCLKAYARHFDAREPFAMQFRMLHHSGAYRWISDRGTPRFAEDGSFLGYIGAGIDIQEAKEAEISLRESELRVRKAESLVLMAGGIAHDFNNLFQALQSNLEIASMKAGAAAPIRHSLEQAKGVLRRAVGLSWKMLDFSGRGFVRLEPMDLGAWLRRFKAMLEQDPACRLRLELACEEAPLIQGDPAKLQEVLRALVDNAGEATGSGGVVNIRIFPDFGEGLPGAGSAGVWPVPRPEGPATVCLEFADNGPGVPEDQLNLICDPFFTTREPGRGLGLAATVGLLRAHRAGLHIQNRPAGGLQLRLHFPPAGA